MSDNVYVESGFVETSYFEANPNFIAIPGEAAIVASTSAAAELFDISDGGNDYLDATYVTPGYFEYVAPASINIEGAGALFHNAHIICDAVKTIEAQSTQASNSNLVSIAARNREIYLYAFPNTQMSFQVEKITGIIESLSTSTTLSANAGKLVSGELGFVVNEYIDSDYIAFGYFTGILSGGMVAAFNQSALIGKRQEGVIGNLTNDYVAPTYIDGGYFFGVSDVILTATLVGDLELVETGFIEGSALLASVFVSNQIVFRQREAESSLSTVSNIIPIGFRTQESNASFEIQTQSQSTAQRARGTSAAFETEISSSTLNSRIRDNASAISSEFQTTTFGQRARAIDLYAFTNGALVAQANVVRDSNTLANTFFNVGTDFIRQRNVSAEGDATVFISNIPTRIRAASSETQDAFSFVPSGNAIRRITTSVVVSSNIDSEINLIKGYQANIDVIVNLDVVPNVIREFDSNLFGDNSVNVIPSITRDIVSNQSLNFTQSSVISAIFGCDMVAFDDAEVIAQGNAIFKFGVDMLSIPGFALRLIPTKINAGYSDMYANVQSQAIGYKIHPFVAEPFEIAGQLNIVVFRTRTILIPIENNIQTILQANGVVRFYFFPTTFTFTVIDEPLANTFFSRTRETGVNI